ncbi:hypothetical protein NA56DRAFT_642960 [Hyaloscypha hepaticicola]|uniref:Uncharacterized protein n=1 Tax=Hyaloscypha hepaticicola TaxID=2082293 RepID=A0A2J6QFZ5_9HELO|nr:hypothetical protein NA56DRAFT_642960 [Hyaloscypha hepaticicola]
MDSPACYIEMRRVFQVHQHVRLRLGLVDRRCSCVFRAWELGPSRDDPPHLKDGKVSLGLFGTLVSAHFLLVRWAHAKTRCW